MPPGIEFPPTIIPPSKSAPDTREPESDSATSDTDTEDLFEGSSSDSTRRTLEEYRDRRSVDEGDEGEATFSRRKGDKIKLWQNVEQKLKDIGALKTLRDTLEKYEVSLDMTYSPLEEVGGDSYKFYFDLNEDGEQLLTIFLGDATGHGNDGAEARRNIAEFTKDHSYNQPKEDLERIYIARQQATESTGDKELPRNNFQAELVARINLTSKQLEVLGAGNDLIFKAGLNEENSPEVKPVLSSKHSLAVGAFAGFKNVDVDVDKEAIYKANVAKVEYKKGDVLVMFTDGLLDAINKMDPGAARDIIKTTIATNVNSEPAEIKKAIIEVIPKKADALGLPNTKDDLTLIVIKL